MPFLSSKIQLRIEVSAAASGRATEQRDELPPPQPGMGSLPGAASIIAASGRPKRLSFAAS